MPFTQPLDIAKRSLQHLGQPTITALTDSSRQAVESTFCYPMLRQAEFRRSSWTFAARRAVLRARTATTFLMTPLAYVAGTTYGIGDIVTDSLGYWWLSVRASNTGNTPGQNGAGSIGINPYWIAYFGPRVADVWASGTYFPGDVVYKTGAPAIAYIATPAQGTSVTTQDPASGAPWHAIAGATVASFVGYQPQGLSLAPSAAVSTLTTRNIYDLPVNFMRLAPQDEKAAASAGRAFLTLGQEYNDFEIESGLLYSEDTGPKIFRFTADHTDVSTMEPLFCEMLALNMARSMCMVLTGSRELETFLEGRYMALASDARALSLIEAGSSELERGPAPSPQQPQAQRGG